MRPFVLIDLWSQASHLPREVRSWPWERFVSWLELFGQVNRAEEPTEDDAFYFISAAGPSVTFHCIETTTRQGTESGLGKAFGEAWRWPRRRTENPWGFSPSGVSTSQGFG